MMTVQPVSVATLPRRQAIPILTPVLRWCWIALVLSSIAFELTPISPVPPLTTYGLVVIKSVVFALLGFLPPLAFQRLTTLIRNMSIALGSAVTVEVLQTVVHHGHSFHWHELIVKVLLVTGGFCLALVVRYERVISAGRLSIRLEPA
jgi:hypothetical protein